MPSPRAIRGLSTEQNKNRAEGIGGDRAGRRWTVGWPISGRCAATVGFVGEDSKEYHKNIDSVCNVCINSCKSIMLLFITPVFPALPPYLASSLA